MQRKWMSRAHFLALSLLSANLFLASCAPSSTQPPASTPRADATATFAAGARVAPEATSAPAATSEDAATITPSTIADASNAFGFNLLHELQRAAPDDNLFISPLSLSLLLHMVFNRADGATA